MQGTNLLIGCNLGFSLAQAHFNTKSVALFLLSHRRPMILVVYSIMKKKKTSHGCKLGRVFSDVSQAHQGFGSVQHHTPHSGDPAGVDQVPTHVPVATLDQSH